MSEKNVNLIILTQYEINLIVNEIFLTGFGNDWNYI